MRRFHFALSAPCGLFLLLAAAGACAQAAPPPGPTSDLYAGTREYRWTFYVPVFSVEREEIVVQAPTLLVRSRRIDYEVPGLRSERRKLGEVAEFFCKYPDWQLPNECGIDWHTVYADLPVLTMRREHVDVDVPEWTSEERRIRFDVPRWTWTERTLTVVVPTFGVEPPPQREWAQAAGAVLAADSPERARATLDSQQAAAAQSIDAAVAALTSSIESIEAQGADARKLPSGDGASIDLYATRRALLDDKGRVLERYAQVRAELTALGASR